MSEYQTVVYICQRISHDSGAVYEVCGELETAHAWLYCMRNDVLKGRAEMSEDARAVMEQWPVTEVKFLVSEPPGLAQFFDGFDEFRVQPWRVL